MSVLESGPFQRGRGGGELLGVLCNARDVEGRRAGGGAGRGASQHGPWSGGLRTGWKSDSALHVALGLDGTAALPLCSGCSLLQLWSPGRHCFTGWHGRLEVQRGVTGLERTFKKLSLDSVIGVGGIGRLWWERRLAAALTMRFFGGSRAGSTALSAGHAPPAPGQCVW